MIEILFLLIHHAQNQCRATATRSGWREHTCIHCGCRYRYRVELKVIGTGPNPEAARVKANNLLQSALKNGIVRLLESLHDPGQLIVHLQSALKNDIVRLPCPTCGLYQPDMVAPDRFRWHAFTFLGLLISMFFVSLLLLVAQSAASEAPFVPLVASCIAVAVIGTGSFVHLRIDMRNPNKSLPENLEVIQAFLLSRKMEIVAAGDELTAKDPPDAAGWRPTGQFALHGIMLLALLMLPAGEMLRLIKGWQINHDCQPVVVGPGDNVKIQFPTRITCVKGNWNAVGRAEILNADDLGVPKDLKLTSCRDNWGNQIQVEHAYDTHAVRNLWAQVELPDDSHLAGQTVHIKMDLDIVYPKWKPGGFENTKETATYTATLAVASERKAGSLYSAYFLVGALGGSALALATSCVLTVRTWWVRSKALPSEFHLDVTETGSSKEANTKS